MKPCATCFSPRSVSSTIRSPGELAIEPGSKLPPTAPGHPRIRPRQAQSPSGWGARIAEAGTAGAAPRDKIRDRVGGGGERKRAGQIAPTRGRGGRPPPEGGRDEGARP